MGIPTIGETFAKLVEHLRLAQEDAAMLAHLRADDSRPLAMGWLAVEDRLKKLVHLVTQMATKGLQ